MIQLSKEHGLNPSVMLCFFCHEPKGINLLGRLSPKGRERAFGHEASKLASYNDVDDDAAAPRQAVYDREPCDKCKEYMQLGIILISVRDGEECVREHECRQCHTKWEAPVTASKATPNISGEPTPFCPKCGSRGVNSSPHKESSNPYRTGGWVVVTEDYVKRIMDDETAHTLLHTRTAFVPDHVWEALHLPRCAAKKDGTDAATTDG